MHALKLVVLVPVVAGSVCCAALRAQDRYPVRRLTSHPAQEGFPSWSPDGRTLVYSLGMRNDSARMTGLWKVSSEGGEARQFTRFIGEHPDWSPDGHYIVFDADEGNAVHLVAATGGQPVRIVPASIRILGGGLPSWSPDGGRIAFKEASNLRVLDVRTGESRVVLSAADSMLVLPGCWSRDGSEIFVTVRHRATYLGAIWRVPAAGGEPRRLTPEPDRAYRYLDLSPDGSLLAFVACEGRNCDLFAMPAAGGVAVQLTREPAYDDTPRWSPDGTRIAFTSTRSGGFDVWVMDVDGDDLRAAVVAAQMPGGIEGPPPAAALAFAAHAELGRLGQRFPADVWPGFRPDTMPFVYWFESGLLLVNPPSPLPRGFAPVAAPVPAAWKRFAPGVDPLEGIDPPTVTSNATVPDTASVFAVAAHEAFHTFVFGRAMPGRRFGRGEDNNVAPDYPLFDPDNEADFAVEARLLRAALAAADRDSLLRLTKRFLAVRQARQRRMGAEIVGYEVAAELNEGLAHYVELRSLSAGSADQSFPWPGAAAAARRRLMIRLETLTRQEQGGARVRFYRTGAAIALLLDRIGEGSWKATPASEDLPLQEVLASAAGYREDSAVALAREAFEASGRDTVVAAARAYAADLQARRQRLADSVLAADGIELELSAADLPGATLRLCSYNPNRVFQTAAGVVLHLSQVRFCSGDLYDASFSSPVLQMRRPGVARSVIGSPDSVRVTIAGTSAAIADGARFPQASDVGVTAPGFGLRARRADVARVGRVLQIRLLP